MDITKVLTISTAHITEETDRKLQDELEVNNMWYYECVLNHFEGMWICEQRTEKRFYKEGE